MTGDLSAAQRKSLDRLVERGTLSAEQAEAVRAELGAEPDGRTPFAGGLWEVLGYAGGALVLGGASLLVGMSWDDLGRAGRVGLLAAATALLIVAGVFIANGIRGLREMTTAHPTPRSRIVSVLLMLASGTTAMAVGSGLDEIDGSRVAIFATLAGLVVAAAAYAALPSVPCQVAAGGFSFGLANALGGEWSPDSPFPMMGLLLVLGALWAVLAVRGVLERPPRGRAGKVRRELGFGIAAAVGLVGAQWPVTDDDQLWWGYGVTFLVSAGCFAAFLALRSTVLLAAGVIGMTVVVPEAVYEWTGGALSGPVIVLVVGAVLLAVGGLGLRLRNRVNSGAA